MSRLLIVARPTIVAGYHLAGVDAHAAEDAAAAQVLIERWLQEERAGLLAIDEGFLLQFDTAFRRRLETDQNLPHLALPTGEPLPAETSPRARIAEMIRRAIGFHITFQGESK